MKRYLLGLLAACFFSVNGQAAPVELKPDQVLTVDFTQYRHLKGIPKPLKSEGAMILWVGNGLIWRVKEPFPSALLMKKSGMYQIEGSLKTPVTAAGGDNAMFDAMAGIFSFSHGQDIPGFDGKEKKLGADQWQIQLNPKQAQVQNFIQSITLEGKTYILKVKIQRPNGDWDEIHLRNHHVADAIKPEQRSQFND